MEGSKIYRDRETKTAVPPQRALSEQKVLYTLAHQDLSYNALKGRRLRILQEKFPVIAANPN